jgi:hypothetical protein
MWDGTVARASVPILDSSMQQVATVTVSCPAELAELQDAVLDAVVEWKAQQAGLTVPDIIAAMTDAEWFERGKI